MNTWKNLGIFAVSAISLGLFACGGSDGSAGAKGDPGAAGATGPAGDSTPASVGVVVPNIGLLDRELDVTITTNGVDLTQGTPTVDVGPGVTVSAIQVLSSTTLYAHLAVDAAAATGPRDVKVTAGSNALTSKGGFKVAAPIAVTVTPTNVSQGSLFFVDVDNLDTQHAFDTAGNFYGLFSDGGQLGQGFSSVTATQATGGVYLADPKASANGTFEAVNVDGNGNPTTTYGGASIAVAPRAATTLTPGTPLTGQSIAAAGGTNIYTYSTSAISILEVSMTTLGTGFDGPLVAVYGDSGKFADMKTLNASVVYPVPAAAATGYVVALDDAGGGGSGFGFTMNAITHTGTAYNEPAGAHDTLAHAHTNGVKVATLPANTTDNGDVIVGSLSAGTEEDWYEVAVGAGDSIEVVAAPDFDGSVDFTDSAGNGLILDPTYGLFPQPLSTSQGARVSSQTVSSDSGGNALPAGNYYVHVTSADGTAHGNYLISLRKR